MHYPLLNLLFGNLKIQRHKKVIFFTNVMDLWCLVFTFRSFLDEVWHLIVKFNRSAQNTYTSYQRTRLALGHQYSEQRAAPRTRNICRVPVAINRQTIIHSSPSIDIHHLEEGSLKESENTKLTPPSQRVIVAPHGVHTDCIILPPLMMFMWLWVALPRAKWTEYLTTQNENQQSASS